MNPGDCFDSNLLFCIFAGWYEEYFHINLGVAAGRMVLIECHRV